MVLFINSETGCRSIVKRRSVLQGLATLICAAEFPGWVFAGEHSKEPLFFTSNHFQFISSLADTLIPQTDTLGALGAGVPAGFDMLLLGWTSGDRQAIVNETVSELSVDLDGRVGGRFILANPNNRLRALSALDEEAYTSDSTLYNEYRFIKALLVRLYYASKPGATQELRYDPIPGGYDGDIPFEKVGRTWATIEVGAH